MRVDLAYARACARAALWTTDPADAVRDLCADVAGPTAAADFRTVTGRDDVRSPCG